LQTNNNTASVAIELSHPDLNIQTQQFEQLLLFKKQFQEIGGTDWRWQKMNKDEGDKVTSTVETSIEHVSLLNESHWPQIISFFKLNLISLDAFWCSYKFALQE
jgi:hypothetical protein